MLKLPRKGFGLYGSSVADGSIVWLSTTGSGAGSVTSDGVVSALVLEL